MGIVTWAVNSTSGFLEGAAEKTFIGLTNAAGTMLGTLAVLAVVLVGINMLLQYRYMDWQSAFGLILKLCLISIFAWNWNEFWKVANALITLGDSLAARIAAAAGSGNGSATQTFAEAFDEMLNQQSILSTDVSDRLGWMGGAIINGISLLLIGLASALAALVLIFSSIMITFYLGIAPIMITLSLFPATKGFFEKWLASAISYAFYPIVISSVFAAIVNMSSSLQNEFGTTAETIGGFIPFVAMMLITVAAVATIPMIVGSITGNVQVANAIRSVAGGLSGMGSAALMGAKGMKGAGGAVAGGMTRNAASLDTAVNNSGSRTERMHNRAASLSAAGAGAGVTTSAGGQSSAPPPSGQPPGAGRSASRIDTLARRNPQWAAERARSQTPTVTRPPPTTGPTKS